MADSPVTLELKSARICSRRPVSLKMEAFLAYVASGSLYRTTMSVGHQKFDHNLFHILSCHDDAVSNAVLSNKRVYTGSIVSQRILQKCGGVRFKLLYTERLVACGAS